MWEIKIKIGDESETIHTVHINEKSKERLQEISNINISIITQAIVNHKLGIMDINEAIENYAKEEADGLTHE